jgi:hypothetical protein
MSSQIEYAGFRPRFKRIILTNSEYRANVIAISARKGGFLFHSSFYVTYRPATTPLLEASNAPDSNTGCSDPESVQTTRSWAVSGRMTVLGCLSRGTVQHGVPEVQNHRARLRFSSCRRKGNPCQTRIRPHVVRESRSEKPGSDTLKPCGKYRLPAENTPGPSPRGWSWNH